ncbi:MAG: hypothetical protein H7A49_14320 [Akkermansiaceae bacterium]|nr:hypothetical protein [Akkermansiaceae bacterium]MCP5545069.1 hypothetical protein [Akkermansiaceae bacterium]MCP5549155.1 hypothetical protein [Akkermansiaceae bacterium]
MNFPPLRSVLVLAMLPALGLADVRLRIDPFHTPSPQVEGAGNAVSLRGPASLLLTAAEPVEIEKPVLEFEYFSTSRVKSFALLAGPPFESAAARYLPEIGHSETWSTYAARTEPPGKPLPSGWQQLRIDLPAESGRRLQIRNAVLRKERPGEFAPKPARPKASAAPAALHTYLETEFPGHITRVRVGTSEIEIDGTAPAPDGGLFLAAIPMHILVDAPESWSDLTPVTRKPDGSFHVRVPRKGVGNADRLTCRWQLVRKQGDSTQPLSHARYADEVACRSPDLPPSNPRNKKGLGGWRAGVIPGEIEELGISSVTVNLMLHSLVAPGAGPDTDPFIWQGKTYHARRKALESYDTTFREAAKHGLMVSAILLVPNPAKSASPVDRTLGHPDATRAGTYAMPNVTSAAGISMYGAVLNLMAERWSRPDGKFGRVHHWIMQNEVDAGWVWTNAGEIPALPYMDLYQRSMRLMWLIAAQYDPHARPFISLTHHWAEEGNPRWYGSRRMLELLTRFTRAEGDFPWGLAYHPYPQNLFNPRTWEDGQATSSFDTKKITPRNLEVLDDYMKQASMRFRGAVRPVHLSENGFNSPDYSPASLRDQAAGMAYAWKKIEGLSSIEAWHYHNWIDNRSEGGLRIGLRKFGDDPREPHGRKPVWHVYQALGTPREDEVLRPYLETIGIDSWEKVR